jgi:hypothetical protein
VEYFVENTAAALAPALTGVVAEAIGLSSAILVMCVTAWVICFFLYLGALFTIDKDTNALRSQMAERAKAI